METLEKKLLSLGTPLTLTQKNINKNFFFVFKNHKFIGKLISLTSDNAQVFVTEKMEEISLPIGPDSYKVFPMKEPFEQVITDFLKEKNVEKQEYEEIRQAAQVLGGLSAAGGKIQRTDIQQNPFDIDLLRALREGEREISAAQALGGRLSAPRAGGGRQTLKDLLDAKLEDPELRKKFEENSRAFKARMATMKAQTGEPLLPLPHREYQTQMLDWNNLYIVSRFADFQEECKYFIYEPKRGILYYNIQLVDLNLDDEVPNLILKNIEGGEGSPEVTFPIGKKQYLFLRTRRNKYCALPGCNASKYDEGVVFHKCKKCMSVFYCSKEHQLLDWKEGKHKGRHQKECREERKMNEKINKLLICISNDKIFVLKMISLCRNAIRDSLDIFQRFINLYDENHVQRILEKIPVEHERLNELLRCSSTNPNDLKRISILKKVVEDYIGTLDKAREEMNPLLEEANEETTIISNATTKADYFVAEMYADNQEEYVEIRRKLEETLFKEDNPDLSFEERNIFGSLLCNYANNSLSNVYNVFMIFFQDFSPENDTQELHSFLSILKNVKKQITNLMWICDPLLNRDNFTSDTAETIQDECIGGGACTSRKEEYDRLREMVRTSDFVNIHNDFDSEDVRGGGGAVMSALVPQKDDELGGGRSRKYMKSRKYMESRKSRKSMKSRKSRKSMKSRKSRKSRKSMKSRKSKKNYLKRKTI